MKKNEKESVWTINIRLSGWAGTIIVAVGILVAAISILRYAAGDPETVMQQIVRESLMTQGLLGLVITALGFVVRKLDRLSAVPPGQAPPPPGETNTFTSPAPSPGQENQPPDPPKPPESRM